MRIRPAALPALAALLALGLSACGSDDDGRAADPAGEATSSDAPSGTSSGTPPTTTASDDPTARQWPTFAATDYTYRLEVLCFCPMTGPLQVTVADGEVTSAVRLQPPGKGRPAPEFARLSIDDIIDKANDPSVFEADVTWPAGADHPSKVAIDQIENATDDEVTYTISKVVVSAG
ncbi:MAG TPA: DUF6174 domain-containing protein [Nocardioides sp.]|nr:DUF6174 domain-containing protein [Nocardioides sp.]